VNIFTNHEAHGMGYAQISERKSTWFSSKFYSTKNKPPII